jgi:hypothetical protein
MDIEGWAKTCAVAAGVIVAVGSALQALNELRAYEDVYDESRAREVIGGAVRFFRADGPVLGALERAEALFTLFTSSRAAIKWAREARQHDPVKWTLAVEALVRARNWGIVLIGAIVAILGTSLDLIAYLNTN